MRSIISIFSMVIILGCSNPSEKPVTEISKSDTAFIVNDSVISNDIFIKPIDTLSTINRGETVKTEKTKQLSSKKPNILPIRYIEFPSDQHINGKPLVHQLEISESNLKKHPDTLAELAIELFKSYDSYFPKSIADNFEEGISIERIDYPKKLIFRFMLFENEEDIKPYDIEEITVLRSRAGEFSVEK